MLQSRHVIDENRHARCPAILAIAGQLQFRRRTWLTPAAAGRRRRCRTEGMQAHATMGE